VERPLVYHLYGDIAAPASMVLTEKDYFDFVINLQSSSTEKNIPYFILKSLATSSLMFIGYNLEDIRAIFQGFITLQKTNLRPTNISVNVAHTFRQKKAQLIIEYLSLYIQNLYDLNIFWGSINEFIKELQIKWNEFTELTNF
jgi:hypothetical protein